MVKFKKGAPFLRNVTAFELDPSYGIQVGILKSGRVSDLQIWDYVFTGTIHKVILKKYDFYVQSIYKNYLLMIQMIR